MIKIVGNELWRAGEKVGWIDGHHVRTHEGTKLGYFSEHHVFDMSDRKIGAIEGNHLLSGETKVPLEKIAEHVEGGVMGDIEKCAVYLLLGD